MDEQEKMSKCKKWGYHDYQTHIDNSEVLVEICHKCGDRQIYNKRDGRKDESMHMLRNKRSMLQPFGKDAGKFAREYGYVLGKYGQKEI